MDKEITWYWVKIDGEWSPAVKDENAAGGWTNLDTWEDFDKEVTEFVKIMLPRKMDKKDAFDLWIEEHENIDFTYEAWAKMLEAHDSFPLFISFCGGIQAALNKGA